MAFQQKILANQRRIVKLELEDTVPVKKETSETKDLEMVEIKTESFEFEPSPVMQSWQEPLKTEIIETEIKIDQDDVPVDVPASPASDEDFKTEFFQDDGSESSDSDLTEEFLEPEEKPLKKKPETSKTRVCPYCAGVFTSAGITAHVSLNYEVSFLF